MPDWTAIQIKYEQGVKPKELAKEYDMTAKQISDKATKSKWQRPRVLQSQKVAKSRKNYEAIIDRITKKALNVVEEVLEDEEAKKSDKLKAADLAFKVGGLNEQNVNVNGNVSEIQFKKITKEELVEAMTFTNNFLNGKQQN